MSEQQTIGAFLTLLQRSRLLAWNECQEMIERLGLRELETPRQAADALVDRQVLTRYQANRLLEGRRRGLFLDDYKILDILGSGGMGYLYSAEELSTGWKVALKVLSERHRNHKGMLTRFQLEAEAGLKLSHPNILRTLAIKQSEDIYGVIHFIVMELVRGISLYELLAVRRSVLPWPQACDIILQAARGLHYAHELGLVHRDVKPENLLIRNDGSVKLLDFGLAMIAGSEAELSAATILGQNCLGTADYIAPEQSLDSLEVDRRADIYSLGCTFYFLLTGQPPFPDKSVAKKLEGHRRLRATPVHEVNPKVPERLSKIIRKMMARRAENRFDTAERLATYLEPLAQRSTIDFDFEAVVRRRAKIAEKRLATESVLRGDSRTTGVSRLEIGAPSELKQNGGQIADDPTE
ncbi:MAG: serine/threonine protein kinase [Pirellulaceae bacterium]|jgi:serine/threonine-protein kinase|nr:serine/threonine protein kinase [Pirellulaceae bacterium]